ETRTSVLRLGKLFRIPLHRELLDILDRHIDHRVETLCLRPALRGFGCGVSALHTDLLPMPFGDLAVAPPRSGLGHAISLFLKSELFLWKPS
ncbi:hypothetical protein M9458_007176, partial [Cirrhinus mrigala]